MDVHARRQPDWHAELLHLRGDHGADLLQQLRVEALSQQRSHRDRRGVLPAGHGALVDSQLAEEPVLQRLESVQPIDLAGRGVDLVALLQPQAGRPVRQDHPRDPEIGKSHRLARGAGHVVGRAADAVRGVKARRADRQEDLLFLCQPRSQLPGPLHERFIGQDLRPPAFGPLLCRRRGLIDGHARGPLGQGLQPFVVGGYPLIGGFDLRQRVQQRAHIAQLRDAHGAAQGQHRRGPFPVGFIRQQGIVSLLQHPRRPPRAVGRQSVKVKAQPERLRLARSQKLCFGKGDQPAIFLFLLRVRAGGVQQHRVPPGRFPGIAHGERNAQLRSVGHGQTGLPRKLRIGQSVSEGIAGLDAEGVEIPVAHIDAVGVKLLQKVPVPVGKPRA